MSKSSSDVVDRSLFMLSWPIFIDLFLHFSTLFINTYMVSQVSSHYVAAMGVGNLIFDLCITIFSFISIGCSVVIAQYLGARNTEKGRMTIHISIALNMLLGISFALFLYLFGYNVLIRMNTPHASLSDAFSYLHILGICLIPEAVSLVLAASMRVYGKAKAAMFITLIVNGVTIIGNFYVLHSRPELGLVGVAYSTLVGRVLGVVLLIWLLRVGLSIRLQFSGLFRWSKELLKNILHIGLPSAGENLLWIVQYATAFAFINLMGEKEAAAQTLYFQIAHLVMLFGNATSIGNEIFVGYLVGAKRFDEAYKRTFKSLKIGMLVTLVIVLLCWLFAKDIMNFLTKDKEVISLLLPLFLLSVFLEPGRTINIVMVNALRASGDAFFPFCSAIFFMWGVSIPLGYYLGIVQGMGLMGIWIGFFCDEWLRGLTNAWRWRSKRWQTKRLQIE